jgi:hypothetical protein
VTPDPAEASGLLYPDWVAASNAYDAVHITAGAIAAAQGMLLTVCRRDHRSHDTGTSRARSGFDGAFQEHTSLMSLHPTAPVRSRCIDRSKQGLVAGGPPAAQNGASDNFVFADATDAHISSRSGNSRSRIT